MVIDYNRVHKTLQIYCFSLERKLGAIFIKWLLATVPAEQVDFKAGKAFLYIPAITVKSA
jgi:hypothetical protein